MKYWPRALATQSLLWAAVVLVAMPSGAQERTVPEAFTAGEETLWWVEVDGERIGHNWSRYEGEVELAEIRAHHFTSQVLLDSEVPGGRMVQQYTCELWTDARGRPLRLAFRAALSDVRAAVDATFAGGTADVHIRQGPTDTKQQLEVEPDSFVLANNFVSHIDMALALSAPAKGERGSLPLFSVNALRAFPVTLQPVEVADGGRVFRDSLGELLHLDGRGRLSLVEIEAQNLQFRRVDDAASEKVERFVIELPTMATEASDLDREDVRIDYGEVSLAGTITRPKGSRAQLPAVFFISGSGGQDRNGISSGIDIGTHEILDRLTRQGFLVLRVDDRGVGESTGPTDGLSFDDLVEDARQAVLFLHKRSDVDPSRIVLIGHSEGGQTAPILAAEMKIGAVVLMAAPGRSVLTLIREQLARAKELAGASAEELEELDQSMVSFYRKIEAQEPIDPGSLPLELQAFAGAGPWLRSHAKQDPIANLKRVRSPVLLLQGARDIQVSAELDAKPLLAALEEIDHPDHELVVFAELDHLFKKTVGEESSGLDYLKNRPVDPEFLDTLANWLKGRLLDEVGTGKSGR